MDIRTAAEQMEGATVGPAVELLPLKQPSGQRSEMFWMGRSLEELSQAELIGVIRYLQSSLEDARATGQMLAAMIRQRRAA